MSGYVDYGQAWAFAQVDDFWERYAPLTPWGKDEAEAKAVLGDGEAIAERYDDIEAALALANSASGDRSGLDRISYHLKRMPRLTLEPKSSYELIELFQIKKFIANYRGLVAALGPPTAGRFGLSPFKTESEAAALASELDRGGSDPETFYVADAFDEGLASARAGVAAADAAIARERVKAEAEARLSFGVSFDGREFLVVPKDAARAMIASGSGARGPGAAGGPDGADAGDGDGRAAPGECPDGVVIRPARYAAEPYDDARYIVRILPSPEALEAMAERERYLDAERLAEERVVARLSALTALAMPDLAIAVAAATRWDRARAGAELAASQGMTRPVLDSETTELVNARFVPCQDECARLGLDYAPLSASFGASAVALFGSNMGGKTVVLKTLLFFQLLAQAGLFVPAERFSTRVYGRIEYVGELSGERLAGLSGFGLEIWRLIAARAASSPRAEGPRRADPANADEGAAQGGSPQGGSPQGGSLVAFDELARTTGSHEAEALLSAVIEAYARGGSGRAYFATHFRGVARMPGVEYRRMRGLDREAAAAALGGRDANGRLDGDGRPDEGSAGGEGRGPALAERLAGINRHMRYEVVEDDGSGSESDALAIASFLGLDRSVIERARYYLTKDGV